ncbi:MAG: response regulator transcription factor [Spirochaetota bacterium]|nr:response regulator transcription factor [Spirochaetota bacterium]
MTAKIGLLSNNSELIEDFKVSISDLSVKNYTSVDSIKAYNTLALALDLYFFGSRDVIQFQLSRIRKKIKTMPVLLILRVNDMHDFNLEWFFDEFILYPFRKGELKIRLKRLITDKSYEDNEDIINIGNLTINLKEHSVYLHNESLELTYKEFELLRFLTQNKDIVFSRKELLNTIWGTEYIGGARTVDVHIRRLRSKLGEEFNSIIETVRNVGYRCRTN